MTCHPEGPRWPPARVTTEILQALGIRVCPNCRGTVELRGRAGTVLRPRGAGWRELR